MTEKIPLVNEVLEVYATTDEGLTLWKKKGVEITCENMLENLFFISSDIARYFDIRHDHFCSRNLCKLQKNNYLPEHLPRFGEMFAIGNQAQSIRIVYALTRHQTEHLIAEYYGQKAFH